MNKSVTITLSLALATTLSAMNLGASNASSKPVLPEILSVNSKKPIDTRTQFEREGTTIQLAILLDTSGSMDGLIEQTKSQIWNIVNELGEANMNNKDITIQVSLFEYGKSSISINEGYLRMLSPLTNDLDLISEKLFDLKTNGGDEYAGQVILSAVNRLAWSNHPDDLKLIIIAGNESFAQGSVDYSYAINKAKNNKIIVNTIFCGNYNKGKKLEWEKGAKLGLGKYMNISQDEKVVYYHSVYDDEINRLGSQLNSTYIGYGHDGRIKKERQIIQDKKSLGLSKSNLAQRNMAKASKQYKASSWDVVSFFESDSESALDTVGEVEEFKGKSKKEIKAELEKNLKKRKDIQSKISELKEFRKADIAKQKAKATKSNKDIGSILIKNIKDIASNKGYTFK